MTKYSSDQPINNAKQDLFSREDYAKKVTKILLSKSITESYAIGLYSPWGYGKTSVLRMIEKQIGKKAIVVRFNPWAYTDQTSMVRGLLIQLASEVSATLPEEDRQGATSTKDKLNGLIDKYGALTGAINSNLEKGVSALSKLITQDSVDDIRKRVEEIIKSCKKRVIVIIDDVDRLDQEEIFQLFKLIKIITNFDRVTYLIAFDDIAVSKALKGRFSDGDDEEAGRKYIEKIIQIPLHLPLIERGVLDKLVLEGIDKCLNEFNIEINQDDVNRFRSVYDDHIAPHIDTPRMVNRYINSIMFTLPMVDSEVNMGDLLLIEFIRLIYPEIYSKLRSEKKLMTGTLYSVFLEKDEWKKDAKAKIDKITSNNEDLIEVLKALFPSVQDVYEKYGGSNMSQGDLRRLKRVASVDYYNRYFTYGVGKNDIADSEIISILSLEEVDDIAANLKALLENKPQDLAMTKLKTYIKSSTSPQAVAHALLKVVHYLSSKKDSVFGRSPIEESTELIALLLSSSKDRLKDYIKLIDDCDNLDQLTYLIREVVLGSKEKEGKDPILSQTDLAKFEKHAAQKIKSESGKQLIHDDKYFVSHHLYYYWTEYGSKEEVSAYLLSKLTDTDLILDFFTKHLAIWHGGGGSGRGDLDNATYAGIAKIVDIQPLYEIIARENPDSLNDDSFSRIRDMDDGIGSVGTEKTKEFRNTLLQQFLYQYKRTQKNEEDQDQPVAE